jgi:hypothetical protein
MREFSLVFALAVAAMSQLDQADPWSKLGKEKAWILLTKVDESERLAVTKTFKILDKPRYEMRQLPIPGDRVLLQTPYKVAGLDFIGDEERNFSPSKVLTEEDCISYPCLPSGSEVIVEGLNFMTVQNSPQSEVWALVTPLKQKSKPK